MATATAATLEPTLLESAMKVVKQQFEEKRLVSKEVPAAAERINTRGTRVTVYVRGNPSFNWSLEGGAMAVPGKSTDVETKVFPVRCSAGFEFTGTFFREAKSPEALVGDLAAFLSRYQNTALKKFEQAFCTTQTNELGVVVSSSSPNVTFATTFANGSLFSNRKIEPDGRYNFYSSSGSQRQGGLSSPFVSTCSATTPPVYSTGVATFDQIPNNLQATDICTYEASYGNAPAGLQDLINNDTGVVQAQSRSVYPQLKAGKDDAGGANISVTRLVKNQNALRYRIDDDNIPLTLVSSYTQYEGYLRQGYGQIRYQGGGGVMKQDFEGATFAGWSWVRSPDIHDDRIYGWDKRSFRRFDLKAFGPYDEDGRPWRLFFSNGTASDKYTGWIKVNRSLPLATADRKFSLIDLDAEMQTGRKQVKTVQRDRLSERTSHVDDATVGANGKAEPLEVSGTETTYPPFSSRKNLVVTRPGLGRAVWLQRVSVRPQPLAIAA